MDPKINEWPQGTESLAPGLIHEMRHPLMGIKAGLELVERAFGQQLRANDDWALVRDQVARLEELFRNYQEFLDPRQAAASSFVLQPVVQRASELVRHRLRRLGDRFLVELTASPIFVHATPNAVSHALVNLLLNSLDALDEAGGKGRLAVRLLPAGADGYVQIRVSDEGSGIPPANAARIFEPGFTTKAPGQGSGLGLDVAQRMVAAWDGALALVPETDPQRLPWARTEFCIRLRAGAASAVAAPLAWPGSASATSPAPSASALGPPPAAAQGRYSTAFPPASGSTPPVSSLGPPPAAGPGRMPSTFPPASSVSSLGPPPAAGQGRVATAFPPASGPGSSVSSLGPPPAAGQGRAATAFPPASGSSPASGLGPPPPAASGRLPTSSPRLPRVLVAEDESVIRFLLRKAFGEERMETLFASTGDEADYILRRQSFDLVVLDKNLPGVNGVDLARLTRERMPNAGIVMITAYASAESAQALFDLGADEYLQKPFDVEHLVALARRILARRGMSVSAPAPAVALRKPTRVAVIESDDRVRARLAALVESLGCVAVQGARVGAALQSSPAPEALVVAADLLSAEARTEIRRYQEGHDIPVVVVVDLESTSDTIGAISVAARARLPRRADDESTARILRSALEGGAPK